MFSFQGPANKAFQLQPHPNIDKELLKNKSLIALKNPSKPFPTNTDVGVLKWRFTTQDEAFNPLSSKLCRFKNHFLITQMVRASAYCSTFVLRTNIS